MASTVVAFSVAPLSPCSTGHVGIACMHSASAVRLAVTGRAQLTQGGNMNLTHPAKWFLRCGGTDAEGGGSDGVGGFAQAWREYPGAGADDGALAEYGAALFARWREVGTTQANREAG